MDFITDDLCQLIDTALSTDSAGALESQIALCTKSLSEQCGNDDSLASLSEKIYELCRRHVSIRLRGLSELEKLTLEERLELEQVEKIIDNNLLTYYFQPIVSAYDGSIYSYEALMRPLDAPMITPFHILKYAALLNRLRDIESMTLVNVLSLIDRNEGLFKGRKVFINSIPNIRLTGDDNEKVSAMLSKHSDTAVIEMTENVQLDEKRIAEIKDHYHSLNVRIAIDDYGTGYSNVKNLLDYMPNYVKIDRSLLSGIEDSRKKRHFVRDIIDFCHDNGILALAEGVETTEELRTVILLGVDLIQGYYTARPSPEVIDKIDQDVVAEIMRYRLELLEGTASKKYTASAGEAVQLGTLSRDGVSVVHIGEGLSEGDTVRLLGYSTSELPIAIACDSGFKGVLEIEQLNLLSPRSRPCITLEDGCEVEIRIFGENRLFGGGIQVPARAKLNVTGKGALYIKLDNSEYFGIGNDLSSRHGDISFNHNSFIVIDCNGQRGIAIGGGSGNVININSGKYLIQQTGSYCCGIGTFSRPANINIKNCDMQIKISGAKCCAVGSLYDKSVVDIRQSSMRAYLAGLTAAGIGSPDGEKMSLTVDNSNISVDVRADELTAVGAGKGRSDIFITKTSFNISAAGHKAYAIGGFTEDTHFVSDNADVSVDITTDYDSFTMTALENISTSDGRCAFTVNGSSVELAEKLSRQ